MGIEELLSKIDGELTDEDIGVAGVIKHTKDILSTYFMVDGNIKTIQTFTTAKVDKQILHTTKLIKVLQEIGMNLCELTQEEMNKVLRSLGLFNGIFKPKQTFLYDYVFKVEAANGLILFTIAEV